MQTVNNVLSGRFRLGIIRYRVQHEAHFLDFLDEKELTFEQVWEYDYEVLLSKAHPTGRRSNRWTPRGWRTISNSPTATRPCRTLPPCPRRRTAPETAKTAAYSSTSAPTSLKFSAASPPPTCGRRPSRGAILEQWGLVQKKCASNRRYRDVLIYPRRYNAHGVRPPVHRQTVRRAQRHRLWRPQRGAANERNLSAGQAPAVFLRRFRFNRKHYFQTIAFSGLLC